MNLHEIGRNQFSSWEPYDPARYRKITLDRLAAVGMHLLFNAGLELNFDNIVVALHKLFPEKFSLLSYPEYPDSIRVDNTLRLDCKHSQYTTGNRTKGFTLTELGRLAAEDTVRALQGQKVKAGVDGGLTGERRNRATLLTAEISKSDAYGKFESGRPLSRFDVCDALHGSLDTDDKRLKRNLQTLQVYAKMLQPLKEYHDLAIAVSRFLDFVETNWEAITRGN